jgi:DNA-binding NtrC family response regulator
MDADQSRGEPEAGTPGAGTGPDVAGIPAGGTDDSPGPLVHILILEDEPADAELAQRLLTRSGLRFAAAVVDTRADFLAQLAAFRPDVIISDFSLPGFSGASALKIAHAECPDIPFIFWSGVLGDEAAVELMKQGATDYILKDRPARLPAAVQQALVAAEHQAQLAQLEDQLLHVQRLASLGQVAAAEQAMSKTRRLIEAARQQTAEPDPRS